VKEKGGVSQGWASALCRKSKKIVVGLSQRRGALLIPGVLGGWEKRKEKNMEKVIWEEV